SPYLCVSWSVPPPPSSTLFPYTTLFRSLLGLVGGPDRFFRAFVEVEVLRVDHDVHIRHAPQLAQLQRGELHLRRTTAAEDVHVRSEEHTSELQSRFDLVCRLLLEKKKNN